MFKLRTIFLTRRAFLAGWSVVLLLIVGWFWAPALVVGKLAVLALVLVVLADIYLLFGNRTGITAQRRTLERWSNGDVNPVTVQLKSEYGTDMHVRVLDELPVQFQKRDLVFTAPLPAWARREFDYTVRPVQRGVYTYGAIQAFVSSDIGFV